MDATAALKKVGSRFHSHDAPEVETPPESILATAAAIAVGVATRNALKIIWQKAAGNEPPLHPTREGVSWSDAIIWAASMGATVGVSRVLARRSVTAGVRRWRD